MNTDLPELITSPAKAFALFGALASEARERLCAAFVDESGAVLSLSTGPLASVGETPILISALLRDAMACRASGLIVAHNHPGGDPVPSVQDVRATRRLSEGAQAIGIRLLDHVVVARGGYRSFRLMGLL